MIKKRITGLIAGCFDLIHPGYIQMFEDAKTVCDCLIIALHEDPSHERSHKHKPVHSLEEREIILKGVKYIDEIVYYKTEKDLEKLLLDILPDYRIIGSDYLERDFTGKDIKNISTHYHDRKHDWSYSKLRRRICLDYQTKP
tara:strand:+ start:143 stop:568 length:426 start_codon:yes stop_codon:yes gene_type:complete